MNDFLSHIGIKERSGRFAWGSGNRPYQRLEGSRIKTIRKSERINRLFAPSIKGGKDRPNVSPAEKIVKESNNAINAASNVLKSISELRTINNSGKDSSAMTDEQLRAAINRLNMERQYSDLTSSDTNKGFEYAKGILDVIGSVATVAVAGTTIITTVHTLKKGG